MAPVRRTSGQSRAERVSARVTRALCSSIRRCHGRKAPMRRLLEIALTGLVSVRLHPLRSLVSFLAVVVVLLPFLVGVALAQGLEADAETSARLGADLYVKGSQFGRPVPVPLKAKDAIQRIEGVTAVVPRIVGEV